MPGGSGIRSHQGYAIVEGCYIGNVEIVIGHNPEAPSPYVCWYCRGGSGYYWGYYCSSIGAARKKLRERYRSEGHMPYNSPTA